MKAKLVALTLFVIFFSESRAQSHETDAASKSEVSKLAFITGKWEGSGWMMGPGGQKSDFNQIEDIQFKIDSTAILIEGLGKSQGKIIHNALAIISYNKKEGNYLFQSYLHNGRKGEFKAELIDGKFYWYPRTNMRYIIELNEKDQWYEVGEMQQETNWFQFFEMTLDRVE